MFKKLPIFNYGTVFNFDVYGEEPICLANLGEPPTGRSDLVKITESRWMWTLGEAYVQQRTSIG